MPWLTTDQQTVLWVAAIVGVALLSVILIAKRLRGERRLKEDAALRTHELIRELMNDLDNTKRLDHLVAIDAQWPGLLARAFDDMHSALRTAIIGGELDRLTLTDPHALEMVGNYLAYLYWRIDQLERANSRFHGVVISGRHS